MGSMADAPGGPSREQNHMSETRADHLAWCKKRAIAEYDFYASRDGHAAAARNAIVSMISDMRKHPDTVGGPTLDALALQLLPTFHTRQAVVNFINGYN